MSQRLAAAWRRTWAAILRRRLERDLDDELSFHLAMREADLVKGGLDIAGARAEARRQFGNVTQFREQTRDMWTLPSLESFAQDVRFAVRTLRRSPGFTAIAVAALAVGIGANTAIFSLIDAMRARALPYRDPTQLVELWGNVLRTTVERRGTSFPDFLDWRAQATSFEDMAAFDSITATLVAGDEPERVPAEMVTAPYFRLLGVNAARGRTFREDEDVPGRAANVVIVSDGLWKRRFGSDPNVVGRTVTVNARPCTIIGVMPGGFRGLSDSAELWESFSFAVPPQGLAARGSRGFAALARTKPGVTVAAARTEMDAIARRLERAYPDTNEKRGVEVSPLDVELFGTLRPALFAVLAAVAFVLLIACANVANLLIARSESRRREIAVRTAIGAGRARLVRQLITESCVLMLVASVAGVLLARTMVSALLAASPVAFPSFVAPGLDLRVVVFTLAVSLACGVLVGLAPAMHSRAVDLGNALKDAARGSDGRRSQRLRNGLVVAEISLAVVLLIGAGLMIRSVAKVAALDAGFDPESVLTLRVSIPRASPPAAAAPGAPDTPPPIVVQARTLVDRIRTVPGVVRATLATDLPLDGSASALFYSAENQPPVNAQNMPRAYAHRVSPDFFAVLRIPFVSGRTFADTELTTASTAVVVSERVVKRFWPGESGVGHRIKSGPAASSAPWLTIVGVVGDVKYRGLPDNPTADPDIYLPFLDRNQQVAVAVRSSVPPDSIAAAVRAAIRTADPSIITYSVRTMDELIGGMTAQSRFTMWLMGIFAAIALALAVIGIYGVMSYLVTQRTREIGIRLALGANRGDIVRLVVGNGAQLIGIGILVGLIGAFALQRTVSSMLFGVTAADIASAVAVAALAIVALAACYLPAARATRVDPLSALRCD